MMIIATLQIVHLWIQEVARRRDLPENVIEAVSATVLTYGSYGLGVGYYLSLFFYLNAFNFIFSFV